MQVSSHLRQVRTCLLAVQQECMFNECGCVQQCMTEPEVPLSSLPCTMYPCGGVGEVISRSLLEI
jgi:hypothetical protein